MAQAVTSVTGGVDPTNAMQTFYTWGSRLAGMGIGLIGLGQGTHATTNRERLLPVAGGIIGGTGIAFGVPYALQNWH